MFGKVWVKIMLHLDILHLNAMGYRRDYRESGAVTTVAVFLLWWEL